MSPTILKATMAGYVAGIADNVNAQNPHHYAQAEAWAWEHGREQGRQHRIRCEVRDTAKRFEQERIRMLDIHAPTITKAMSEIFEARSTVRSLFYGGFDKTVRYITCKRCGYKEEYYRYNKGHRCTKP